MATQQHRQRLLSSDETLLHLRVSVTTEGRSRSSSFSGSSSIGKSRISLAPAVVGASSSSSSSRGRSAVGGSMEEKAGDGGGGEDIGGGGGGGGGSGGSSNKDTLMSDEAATRQARAATLRMGIPLEVIDNHSNWLKCTLVGFKEQDVRWRVMLTVVVLVGCGRRRPRIGTGCGCCLLLSFVAAYMHTWYS
jgi:hypothetical protein